jgi:hypothetical protein
VALLVAIVVRADEPPRRIMETFADLGDVHRIFLAPGLASVLQLPYPVTEAKIGSPDQVQAVISKTLPSELTLTLKTSSAQPTNLIVRCGSRTFVFDIIPSRRTHQDLIRISGAYGGPSSQGAVLLDSSRAGVPDDGRVLIDSSRPESVARKGAKR